MIRMYVGNPHRMSFSYICREDMQCLPYLAHPLPCYAPCRRVHMLITNRMVSVSRHLEPWNSWQVFFWLCLVLFSMFN